MGRPNLQIRPNTDPIPNEKISRTCSRASKGQGGSTLTISLEGHLELESAPKIGSYTSSECTANGCCLRDLSGLLPCHLPYHLWLRDLVWDLALERSQETFVKKQTQA